VVYNPSRGPDSSYEKHRELSLTVATGMMIEKKKGDAEWQAVYHTGLEFPYSAGLHRHNVLAETTECGNPIQSIPTAEIL